MLNISQVKKRDLWYVVGFITADGCLVNDGRHITIVSKDYQILKDILVALKYNIKITKHQGGISGQAYRIQMGSVEFYKFLENIGLTQNKSLTLGKLNIPNRYFPDFLRGVIDGDGSILSWLHAINGCRQWAFKITSSADDFINWLSEKIESRFNVVGKKYLEDPSEKSKNKSYKIKFGKLASKKVFSYIYYEDCLCLERKRKKAIDCLNSSEGWQRYQDIEL